MEECGRGAAVEQLTARGMEYQSPQWGAIGHRKTGCMGEKVSIPAMGGNSPYIRWRTVLPFYQSPRWGAIDAIVNFDEPIFVSIPAMGAIGTPRSQYQTAHVSIPAMGAIGWYVSLIGLYVISIPAMGAIDQDYVGRFHYNRKRQLCQARPHLTCTNRTSLKERTCLIPNSSFLILKGAPGERAGEPPLPVGQEVYKENPVGFSALLMHRFILF